METFSALLALCAGHRWILISKASGAELWYFLWSGDLRRHRAHYDVTIMLLSCKIGCLHYRSIRIILKFHRRNLYLFPVPWKKRGFDTATHTHTWIFEEIRTFWWVRLAWTTSAWYRKIFHFGVARETRKCRTFRCCECSPHDGMLCQRFSKVTRKQWRHRGYNLVRIDTITVNDWNKTMWRCYEKQACQMIYFAHWP